MGIVKAYFFDYDGETDDSGTENGFSSDDEADDDYEEGSDFSSDDETNNTAESAETSDNDIEALTGATGGLNLNNNTAPTNLYTPAYKRRLLLGEGSFTFCEAYVNKKIGQGKVNIGGAITATEFMSREQVEENIDVPSFNQRLLDLENAGVHVHFGVNATRIHESFPGQIFPRIHFNFPHVGGSFLERNPQNERKMPALIRDFFASAAQHQEIGGRIHIALPKIPDPDKRAFYEAYIYNIYESARAAGYKVTNKKHKFTDIENGVEVQRYPGYEHMATEKGKFADVAKQSREWVFEKTDLSPAAIRNNDPPRSRKSAYLKTLNAEIHDTLPNRITDNESSDGELSDVENFPPGPIGSLLPPGPGR